MLHLSIFLSYCRYYSGFIMHSCGYMGKLCFCKMYFSVLPFIISFSNWFFLILIWLRLRRATIFLSIFYLSHIPARPILTLHIRLMTCRRLFLPIWTKVLLSEAWISIRWNKLFFLVSVYWDIVIVSFTWTLEWTNWSYIFIFLHVSGDEHRWYCSVGSR